MHRQRKPWRWELSASLQCEISFAAWVIIYTISIPFQDKDAAINELKRELLAIKEDLKELNHTHQVMEKKMLKTQEDYDVMKSKYESYKDIEIVR